MKKSYSSSVKFLVSFCQNKQFKQIKLLKTRTKKKKKKKRGENELDGFVYNSFSSVEIFRG